jgi:hypothetical protein
MPPPPVTRVGITIYICATFSRRPLTLKPAPTRWGTWIEAVNFYSELFENVKSIFIQLPICEWIPDCIQWSKRGLVNCLHLKQCQLASTEYKMFRNPWTSYERIYGHNDKCKWKAYCWEKGGWCVVSTKLQAVLKRTPGFFLHFQVPVRNLIEKTLLLRVDNSFAKFHHCDIERSFSAYKHSIRLCIVNKKSMTAKRLEIKVCKQNWILLYAMLLIWIKPHFTTYLRGFAT